MQFRDVAIEKIAQILLGLRSITIHRRQFLTPMLFENGHVGRTYMNVRVSLHVRLRRVDNLTFRSVDQPTRIFAGIQLHIVTASQA